MRGTEQFVNKECPEDPDGKDRKMAGYLIKETTCEERKQIVEEALGNLSASCDGCMAGLADMYQDYIDGKKRNP